MKIVIVDDDRLVSLSLKTILETNNEIQVLAVGENGEEAVLLYNTHKPDVLLIVSYRALAQKELPCNFAVAQSVCHQFNNFLFLNFSLHPALLTMLPKGSPTRNRKLLNWWQTD